MSNAQPPTRSSPVEPSEPTSATWFSFQHVDDRGKTWEGRFFYKRPSLRDLLRIESERVRLLEGQELDREFAALASILARLKVVLREVPAWCKWDELEDAVLLAKLNEEVDRIEGRWFRGGDAGGGREGTGARPAP